MNNTDYKAIFVKRKTHKFFAIEAKKREMTFDELVNSLLGRNIKSKSKTKKF